MAMAALTLLFFFLFFSSSVTNAQENVHLVPALYIFGDSTVDAGNLPDLSPPYGIDLNATARNRWSNGQTIADFIATLLGLPLVPPYNNTLEAERSTTGVNYAFAACGILPQTGPEWCWSFDEQISRFNLTLATTLPRMFNQQDLLQHLSKSVFLISFGINDYTSNFLPPKNGPISTLAPDAFAKFLLCALAERVTVLYGMGARKFVVNNIWPMGCTPIFASASNCCNETINQLVLPYSNRLPVLLKELQFNLSGAVFSHSNDFEFVADLKDNPAEYGITNTTGQCLFGSILCPNRDNYLYFDYIHTTQAANHVFALNCFNGTLCSPKNIIGLLGAS